MFVILVLTNVTLSTVHVELKLLPNQTYILVPFTLTPGLHLPYYVEITSEKEFTLSELLPRNVYTVEVSLWWWWKSSIFLYE